VRAIYGRDRAGGGEGGSPRAGVAPRPITHIDIGLEDPLLFDGHEVIFDGPSCCQRGPVSVRGSSSSMRDVRSKWSERHRTELGAVSEVRVELDGLIAAGRRDLANALLRAARCAVLEETRVLVLDLLVELDDAVLGGAA
jgi:hypothetical protein